MSFFNEFPHTRTYDSDLGWIIKRINDQQTQMDGQATYMEELKAWMDENEPRIDHIEEVYDLFESGQLPTEVVTALENWLEEYGVLSEANAYTDEKTAVIASNLATEISARTNADTLMQAEIDQLVAPTGTAPSTAEIENARIGTDGVTYDTLGNAIRSQFTDVKTDLSLYSVFPLLETAFDYLVQYIDTSTAESGLYKHDNTTDISASANDVHFPPVPIMKGVTYWHGNIRNYFSKFIYFDGTVEYFADADNYNTGYITAAKSGFAYISTPVNAQNNVLFTNKGTTAPKSKGIYLLQPKQNLTASYHTAIVAENYASLLPDLDSAENNRIYVLNFSNGATTIPANYPYSSYKGNTTSYNWLITAHPDGRSNDLFATQLLIIPDGTYLIRQRTTATTWSAWRRYEMCREIIVAQDGTGDYTSLVSAIAEANKGNGCIVRVNGGTYDLVEEFNDRGWLDWTSSFTGITLENNIHVIFSSDSKVTFNYTGSNEWILAHVSPFNAGVNGFTLENLTLEASRCRYCVHDERNDDTVPYRHIYKNCSMYLDNSNNPSWTSKQCIGGGLGKAGEIVIENCIFDSENVISSDAIVSYHNSAQEDCKSNVIITGNYFKRGTARGSYYGTSTNISRFLVTNNSMQYAPYVIAETSVSTVVNVEMLAFNNIVR